MYIDILRFYILHMYKYYIYIYIETAPGMIYSDLLFGQAVSSATS